MFSVTLKAPSPSVKKHKSLKFLRAKSNLFQFRPFMRTRKHFRYFGPIRARKLGLAAVKHKQQQAERTERTEQQGRAFVALAHVVADTGGGGWPESMQRELQFCRTPQERNAWAVKWGAYLSGQVEREKRGAPERPPRGNIKNSGSRHPP